MGAGINPYKAGLTPKILMKIDHLLKLKKIEKKTSKFGESPEEHFDCAGRVNSLSSGIEPRTAPRTRRFL
jgi:hypothetical protein